MIFIKDNKEIKIKMSNNCFVCLNKTKNKVCMTCKCYAHPGCWGEYLKNTTHVFTLMYPDRVVMSTPLYAKCPQCRGSIGTVKSITRSDTNFTRRASLIESCMNFINCIEMAELTDDKISFYRNLFNLFIDNKSILNKEVDFIQVLKSKLYELYYISKWEPANMYYYTLFGNQLESVRIS
jgi:hypothetical protein